MKLNDTTPSTAVTSTSAFPGDAAWMEAHWMPYTANRNFKANPRMMVSAQGAYYTDNHGRKILDGLSGMAAPKSPRRSAARLARWTIPPPSSSATRCRLSWPTRSAS